MPPTPSAAPDPAPGTPPSPAAGRPSPPRPSAPASPDGVLHRAARVDDAAHAALARLLRRRGWTPRVLPYAGYGTDGWVRVLGRVLLCPPGARERELRDLAAGRGWRRFLSAPVAGVDVEVTVAGRTAHVTSTRGGYLDHVLDADLPAGPTTATLTVTADGTGPDARAPLFVVGPQPGLGLVSDIDDTVLVTAIPRPMHAFWNTFLRHETSRRPVPGMAALYQDLRRHDPGCFVVYLSTGAWNVAPALASFLARYGYPPGPLLLTDWGPTPQGWFRSGREHKRTQLRRLMTELPQLRWLLIGDDGQHDPQLYREAADAAPTQVRAVLIRQLTATQQVLAHGTPTPLPDQQPDARSPSDRVPELRAPDGAGLLAALRTSGVLDPRA